MGPEDAAERPDRPRLSQRRLKVPSVEAVRAVVNAAEERDPRLAPLSCLAPSPGCGEVNSAPCGGPMSTWNVGARRFPQLVVAVGGLAEKTTKTDRFRRVALDEVGVLLLRQHLANVERWAKEADAEMLPDAYVFSPYFEGSKPFRPDNVTNFFIRAEIPGTERGPSSRPSTLHGNPADRSRGGRPHGRWAPRPLRPLAHSSGV